MPILVLVPRSQAKRRVVVLQQQNHYGVLCHTEDLQPHPCPLLMPLYAYNILPGILGQTATAFNCKCIFLVGINRLD